MITDAAAKGADQAQISEGGRGQADGIVEEAAQKIDAALALADQHHQVFRLRIVRRGRRGQIALLALVAQLAVPRLRRPRPASAPATSASRGPTWKRSGGRRCPCGCPCSGWCGRCRRSRWLASIRMGLIAELPLQLDGGRQSGRACSDDDRRALFHAGNRSLPDKLLNRSR